MSDISAEKLKTEIAAILDGANLATTSAKKVRLELEERLGVELGSRKKEIDRLVMDYVNSIPPPPEPEEPTESEEEEEEPKRKRKTRENEDKPKKSSAKRGRKSENDGEDGAKKTKKGGGGYTKALRLSPALADLMGEESMPRHEVVKRVWAIIKERNLYDPNNKQFAICDDSLHKVFGCKRFRTFGMMKYLKTHFYD